MKNATRGWIQEFDFDEGSRQAFDRSSSSSSSNNNNNNNDRALAQFRLRDQ
jgi:hypothetical protein